MQCRRRLQSFIEHMTSKSPSFLSLSLSLSLSLTHTHTQTQTQTQTTTLLACRFIQRGTPRLIVRRGAHTISTLGCAACAIPLAAGLATTPAAATVWLVLFQSCYAFSFGGFHAYVQVGVFVCVSVCVFVCVCVCVFVCV